MPRTRLALLALPALLLGAGELRAQQIPSPFRWIEPTQGLGVYAGYLWTNPTVNINEDEKAELGPQSAPIFGIRYHGRLTGPLDAQVSVGFSPSERKIIRAAVSLDSARANPTDTGLTASMPLLTADAGFRLNLTGPRTYHSLQPYVGASGGVVTWLKKTSSAESAAVTSDQRFDFGPSLAVGLRAGTDWYATRRISVNVEASDRLWKLAVPRGFRVGENPVDSEWKNNYAVTVGGSYHF